MEGSTMIKTMNGNFSNEPISHLMNHSLPDISFPERSTVRDATDDDPNQGANAEISIFDARKYFNETSVNEAKVSKRVSPVNVISLERISEPSDLLAVPRFSSASSFDGFPRNYRARSFNATPTTSSKASWNSQTGLLSNPPGAIAVSMRNLTSDQDKKGGPATASKWLFGRMCPCSGKKSVQVEENLSVLASESKTPPHLYKKKQTHKSIEVSMDTSNWSESREVISKSATYRISAENRFPNLGLGHRIFASGRAYSDSTTGFTFPKLKQNTPPYPDPPLESLEIFQPSDETSVSRKSTELKNQTKLVSRQSFTFPASPSRARIAEDDVASDTSSDLFEIESFSTQSTLYPMHHRRDSLDEASSFDARRLTATNINGSLIYNCRRSLDEPMTPSILTTECYEPSEASIDWSVTTAEGFDKGSVTDYSVVASEIDDMAMVHQENGGGGCGGSGKKKIGNGLLNCRCEKAVNVGPNPVKYVPEVQRMGQHNAYMHVSSRAQNLNKPSLARSQSYRLPLPFAT
ncbi:protein PHYTOCHROME KINASE SUBSTRATE 4 [Mangifera indica]|uniref:protein PHYTOCHROME KINASE SUBSTRATE 4 n=1 Tax=Mangifera indica TaxID=29780 RepID=UPI001CFBB07A|nr:protein PHYTOCHROME KINASE SUBSTRATE 4 [Mangifera indica]